MFNQILQEKTILDNNNQIQRDQIEKEALNSILENKKVFESNNDEKVSIIHRNQDKIKENLNIFYKQNENIIKYTKEAERVFDEFVEYLKEAGDLFNYANILNSKTEELYNKIISNKEEVKEN